MMMMMISQRGKKNTRNTLKTKFIKPKMEAIKYKQKANKMKRQYEDKTSAKNTI